MAVRTFSVLQYPATGGMPAGGGVIATVTLNPSLDEWIHLPSLAIGQLNRATGFARYPGGKGLNVSRVVHELGGRTTAFAFAGGEDGSILRKRTRELAIPHEFIDVGGSTRNNYKIRTADPRALTEINTQGPSIPRAALLRLERRLVSFPVPRCFVLSGSLPPGVPPSIYQRWIRRFRGRRIPTVLDTSGRALALGLAARPWLIKPNRQEAEELLKRRLDSVGRLAQAAQALRERGAALVILSMGGEGALLACADPRMTWLARPPAVRVDSAVGAGDSMVGGFLSGWMKGWPLLDAFRLGVASGTAAAMTPGTELCHAADVKRLLPRVTVRQLE